MRKGDVQLVNPNVWLAGTKSSIEALTGMTEGAVAWATDTDEPGWYDGVAWDWGLTAVTGSHSDLQDLDQDDHPQYVLADGSRPITLTDAAGVDYWEIQDSTTAKMFRVDSDGGVDIEGHVAVGNDGSEPDAQYVLYVGEVGDVTDSLEGMRFNFTKFAGATDYNDVVYGMYFNLGYNQSGGVIGDYEGIKATMQHYGGGDVGTSSFARDMVFLDGDMFLTNGTVYGVVQGVRVEIDQGVSHTADGNLYGLYVETNLAGTVNGTAYGVYVKENATNPPNYGVYQDGSAQNYFGGSVQTAGLLRAAHGHFNGTSAPGAGAGAGVELQYTAGAGYVSGYNRATSSYTNLYLRGANLNLSYQNSPHLRVQNGYIEIPDACAQIRGTSGSYPDLGLASLSNNAYKWGNIYQATGKDVFPDSDSYGLGDRVVTHGRGFDEHYRAGAEESTWSGWATYTGFVTPSSITYQSSCLHIGHSSSPVRAFRYKAHTGNTATVYIHCGVNYHARVGIRLDDGSDTGDNEGSNNFLQFYVWTNSVNTQCAVEYRTGGGSVTTINYDPQLDPTQMHTLLIYNGDTSSTWSYGCYLFGSYQLSKLIRWAGGFTWVPTRVGIYFENTSTSTQNRGVVDWGYWTT